MRAFIAIELPKEIRLRLFSIGADMPGRLTRVSEDKIHITLQFLGEINDAASDKVISAVQKISASKFTASVKGISYFGDREIHTVFAKILDQDRISEIYNEIGRRLDEEGLNFKSEREYTPHATIARVKQSDSELKAFINQNSEKDFGEFQVDSICVKKSVLSEEGPEYSDIFRFKLKD